MRRSALVLALSTALLAWGGATSSPASASQLLTGAGLSATVSGGTVSAAATVKAAVPTTVQEYGICVRSSTGANLDLPRATDVLISTTGTRTTASGTFAPGSYSYFWCARTGTTWRRGVAKTFVVGTTPPPASSTAMPTGDLPGWHQTFADDFTTPVPLGSFPGTAYGARWSGYGGFGDTSGHGRYDSAKVLSVANGALDYYLHTESGVHYVAAPIPSPAGNWGAAQTYGRYSVRFRADPVAGYKIAFLLWPTSNTWAEGEIDYPEGDLSGQFYPASLVPGSVSPAVFEPPVKAPGGTMAAWHTATTEWTPGGVSWFLDGALLASTTRAVPSTPMRWTLQAETAISATPPADTAAGHVLVDWVAQYSYAP